MHWRELWIKLFIKKPKLVLNRMGTIHFFIVALKRLGVVAVVFVGLLLTELSSDVLCLATAKIKVRWTASRAFHLVYGPMHYLNDGRYKMFPKKTKEHCARCHIESLVSAEDFSNHQKSAYTQTCTVP